MARAWRALGADSRRDGAELQGRARLASRAPARGRGRDGADRRSHLFDRSRVHGPGSRPGYYLTKSPNNKAQIGTKNVEALRWLVADYTLPHDLVCDPFAGTGTIGAACRGIGRRYIGAELEAPMAELGRKRIRETTQLALDGPARASLSKLRLGR